MHGANVSVWTKLLVPYYIQSPAGTYIFTANTKKPLFVVHEVYMIYLCSTGMFVLHLLHLHMFMYCLNRIRIADNVFMETVDPNSKCVGFEIMTDWEYKGVTNLWWSML